MPHALHYALKANSTLAMVRLLRELGSGADANSVGEIEVALRAGFDPPQIVFTGVGKTLEELDRAIGLDVKTINAESPGELRAHRRPRAGARGRPRASPCGSTRTSMRSSHPHISTGLQHQQVRRADRVGARPLSRGRRNARVARPSGVHVHVGSQITSLEPLARAAAAHRRAR